LFRKQQKIQIPVSRPKVFLSKRSVLKALLAISVISLGMCLYLWLPTINPGTYYLFTKAKNAFLKGQNAQTISILDRILNKEPSFLAAYPLLGDVYQRLGQPDDALKYYFEYALHSQARRDKKNLASAYVGIGWIYQGLGEYAKALDFYNQAITLARSNHDSLNEAITLRKMAVWHMDKEEYDKALELLTKSSQINLERKASYAHRYNLACDYFDMGLLFSDKDDLSAAEGFYRKSRSLFEKLKVKGELSDYYFNLGEIHLSEKEYQKALDCYFKGLKIDQLHGNKPSEASDYNMIGELYVEIGNLNEAEKYFNQAVLLCEQIKAPLELAAAYYNLGLLYKEKRYRHKAREYLRQAQEIYRAKGLPASQEIREELLELDDLS
ncbi:MAG: tetratricopeptide repeat protein, partial [Candidatus Omnitrophica bacterium]|nr:tetratricopeptide repeat protein [Candidatus Omnitrophota bacterium]